MTEITVVAVNGNRQSRHSLLCAKPSISLDCLSHTKKDFKWKLSQNSITYTHIHTYAHLLWNPFKSNLSVQFSHSVMSDSLRPHGSQHARPPCPSPTPGVHSDSRPRSWWCHPAISSSVVPLTLFKLQHSAFSNNNSNHRHNSLFNNDSNNHNYYYK